MKKKIAEIRKEIVDSLNQKGFCASDQTWGTTALTVRGKSFLVKKEKNQLSVGLISSATGAFWSKTLQSKHLVNNVDEVIKIISKTV